MKTTQASKTNWPAGVLIGSSMLILFLVIGGITAWIQEINVRDGVYDTTLMNAVFWGAIYFAVPCGLINLFVGNYARSSGRVKKKLAITGMLIGVAGILIGLLAWAWFSMISSFVF